MPPQEQKKKLNIGDELFKMEFRLLSYEVFGILEREEGLYYQIKCKNCTDHDSCHILITRGDYGELKYVNMLSEDQESPRQYIWHSRGVYFSSKKEALEDYYKRKIVETKNEIEKLKKKVEESEGYIAQTEDIIKSL